ncbi:flagellar hook-associated protein FlgL [Clostridium malenominatum]|uniref:Flagellar hook-associated protein FlgL n=1 Tax=Clostridium malenominatum TaxID=1539 RepID=A0ABN1IZ97_9CLOT
MRVTNKMLANNFLVDMNRNLSHLQTLQSQLTSGKEIRRPSDDPFKVARAMQMHTDINTNKQYNENIKDTINWLDTTDTALNQMGKQMKRVRELLVTAGNPGYGADERKKLKDEINEIVGQFSNSLNANFDGKYIFGGTRATSKPVDIEKVGENSKLVFRGRDGEVLPEASIVEVNVANLDTNWGGKEINFEYKGNSVQIDLTSPINSVKELGEDLQAKIDSGELKGKLSVEVIEDGGKSYIKFTNQDKGNEIKISATTVVDDLNTLSGQKISDNQLDLISEKLVTEISQGVRVEYNVTATEVLEFKDNNGKEWDAREVFEKIATHLDNNDVGALTGEDLEAIDAVLNNILKIRSQVGAKQNSMEGAQDRNTEENFNMTEILSKTEDINLTEKTMEYAVAQTVYIAALQTSARVLQPTLMDYIR